MKWYLKNKITVTEKEKELILLYHGKMKNKELAKQVGISYSKLKSNIRSLGLIKKRGKVVAMFQQKEEMFDLDQFAKYYNF